MGVLVGTHEESKLRVVASYLLKDLVPGISDDQGGRMKSNGSTESWKVIGGQRSLQSETNQLQTRKHRFLTSCGTHHDQRDDREISRVHERARLEAGEEEEGQLEKDPNLVGSYDRARARLTS